MILYWLFFFFQTMCRAGKVLTIVKHSPALPRNILGFRASKTYAHYLPSFLSFWSMICTVDQYIAITAVRFLKKSKLVISVR